jgi:N-acetyl sugar amidotransferase
MKYCSKCLFPDTKPDLKFDENDVCDACVNATKKDNTNWVSRRHELEIILEKNRSKDGSRYDCIIPVSGGKDSTYQTHVIKNEFGLNPLIVNFHPINQTELGRKNLENIKNLGVDCIEISANPQVYRKIAKMGLEDLGDPMWPEHIGLFTVPVRIAVSYKVPLIVWGENPQLEYGGSAEISGNPNIDKEYCYKHGGYFMDKISTEDLVKYNFDLKDLLPFIFPSNEEIMQAGIKGIFLGYYLKWDARKQLEVVKKLGFQTLGRPCEGTFTDYENLDSPIVPMHDYFKFLKFGYGRATDQASIDIRNNRLSRIEALKLIKSNEGKIPLEYFDDFLKNFDLSKDEFLKICEKWTNKEIFKTDEHGILYRDENNNLEKKKYDNN